MGSAYLGVSEDEREQLKYPRGWDPGPEAATAGERGRLAIALHCKLPRTRMAVGPALPLGRGVSQLHSFPCDACPH